MKVLISSDNKNAHYYIRMAVARVLTYAGHQVVMWDIHKKSAYDMFDEFEPDVFFGQTYNLNNAVYNCIKERPHLKVMMKASDWGPLSLRIKEDYPILYAKEEEISLVRKLFEETGQPQLLKVHHHPDWLESTHGFWMEAGFKVHSLLNAADLFEFYPDEEHLSLKSDLSFIGGYWPYKANNLDKYILPLCNHYSIKIFGNQPWPTEKYCGFLEDGMPRKLFISTKVNLNVHEPHSNVYGYDIIERPFKIWACGGNMVSDYVLGLEALIPFGNYAHNPKEFKMLIDDILARPYKYESSRIKCQEEVLKKHTYFERVDEILYKLGIPNNVLAKKKEYFDYRQIRICW